MAFIKLEFCAGVTNVSEGNVPLEASTREEESSQKGNRGDEEIMRSSCYWEIELFPPMREICWRHSPLARFGIIDSGEASYSLVAELGDWR